MELPSASDLPSLSMLDEIFDKISCESPNPERLSTSITEQLQQIIIKFFEEDVIFRPRTIWELEPDTFLIKNAIEPMASYFVKCTLAQAKNLLSHQIPLITYIVDTHSFLDLEILRINSFFAKFPDASPVFLEIVPTPPSTNPMVPCAHITYKRLTKLLLDFAPLLPSTTRHTLNGYYSILLKQYPDQTPSKSSAKYKGKIHFTFLKNYTTSHCCFLSSIFVHLNLSSAIAINGFFHRHG